MQHAEEVAALQSQIFSFASRVLLRDMMRSRPAACRLGKLADLIEADGFFQQGLIGAAAPSKTELSTRPLGTTTVGSRGTATPAILHPGPRAESRCVCPPAGAILGQLEAKPALPMPEAATLLPNLSTLFDLVEDQAAAAPALLVRSVALLNLLACHNSPT